MFVFKKSICTYFIHLSAIREMLWNSSRKKRGPYLGGAHLMCTAPFLPCCVQVCAGGIFKKSNGSVQVFKLRFLKGFRHWIWLIEKSPLSSTHSRGWRRLKGPYASDNLARKFSNCQKSSMGRGGRTCGSGHWSCWLRADESCGLSTLDLSVIFC